ncbi:MAG: TrkH family potassium uptake protein [Neisseriaceae bacterium]|nr:TrkH family potassium uptake protein [Neisseriaceae bacterium]
MNKLLPTIHIFSKLGLFFALLMWLPTLVSYLFNDEAFYVFKNTAIVTVIFSGLVWLVTRRYQRELRPRDGFILVVMMWLGFALIAAIPIYFYLEELSFTDAFFEGMSALTTTGASVIPNLEKLPPSLNFWRHLLCWLGGMGIIVLAVAILPMLGVGGTQLFKAEIPGVEKDTKIAPRISQVAKRLWLMYFSFTFVIGVAFYFSGMNWFDALCHAMSAFSLTGFSTKDKGIAYFDSVAVETIIILATIAGSMSFANHFTALKQKNLKKSLQIYWQNEEVRIMLIVLFFSMVITIDYLIYKGYYSPLDALRYVTFNFINVALTAGFSNADFASWPLVITLWLFFLANILANAGSMGGGVKLVRAIALAKITLRETLMLQHPNAVHSVKVNDKNVNERLAMSIMAFIFMYFMTVVLFTFIMMITGEDLITAFSAVLACVTNTGVGLGGVGPSHNFGTLNDLQKWLCIFAMLLGRLEMFTVFILFTPAYWKK